MAEVILYYPERNGEHDPAYIEGGIVGELVRCKNCKHRGYDSCPMEPCCRKPDNWFCADGERKSD